MWENDYPTRNNEEKLLAEAVSLTGGTFFKAKQKSKLITVRNNYTPKVSMILCNYRTFINECFSRSF